MKHFIAIAATAVILAGCAMRDKPVLQIDDAPISVAGGEESVASAIKTALKGREWSVLDETPGKIRAEYRKPNADVGDHVVVVDITYDADSYSIDYVDSKNMRYDGSAGTIHRNYNRWVANLERDLSLAE